MSDHECYICKKKLAEHDIVLFTVQGHIPQTTTYLRFCAEDAIAFLDTINKVKCNFENTRLKELGKVLGTGH